MAFTFGYKDQQIDSTADPITTLILTPADCTLIVLTVAVTGTVSRAGGSPTLVDIDGTTQSMLPGLGEASAEGEVEIWYAVNDNCPNSLGVSIDLPNTGTINITTSSSSYSCAAGNWAYFHERIDANGVSTAPSVTVTPPAGQYVIVDSMFSGYGQDSGTNNRTKLYSNDTGNEINAHQYHIGSSTATIAMSYTTAASDDWCITALCFAEYTDGDLKRWNGILNQNITVMDSKKWNTISKVNTKKTGN
tara:strand:+ start:2652 stop:3395 length:744 start_codon:yes stop_codon:yes gene_type:complete